MNDDPTGKVWYFAYGSNLLRAKREARADLAPVDEALGVLRDWRLVFDVVGLPWVEPVMASVRPSPGDEVHGLLLHITRGQLEALDQSEGGAGYYGHATVEVETYDGRRVEAVTYTTLPQAASKGELLPSERYLDLIRRGCRENGFDATYCDRLDELPTAPSTPLTRFVGHQIIEGMHLVTRLDLGRPYFAYFVTIRWVDRRLGPVFTLPMIVPLLGVGLVASGLARLRTSD